MLKKKTDEIFENLTIFSNKVVEILKDEKGEDPDGGVTKWLITLGIAVGVLILIYTFLQGFFPGFLNAIFDRVKGFFA